MSWYACATKRAIPWLSTLSRGGVKPRFLVFHLSAGEQSSLYGYFSGIRTAGSHLHVARDGRREQYADTAVRSAAEAGVKDTISVETQGADDGGPWTPEQCESLAVIAAEAHRVDGIPLRLAERSDDPAGGIAWHRLGVDGNFPAGQLGGRAQRGGVSWSGARGKLCPGDARIKQIPGILARAKQLVTGAAPAKPTPPKSTTPTPAETRAPRALPTIKRGARGGWVGLWQSVLNANGGGIKVDEDFGPATERATAAWQRARGLSPDGVVGPRSWTRALTADADGRLRQGDRGPHVEILQNIVGVATDRVFGADTARWTKAVQRHLGVSPDAVVGPDTVGALVAAWT